uniref:Replication protein n=1 Tax=uncultured prokaryote TaxID=198431 RepID=A0A0H5Q3P5_9ZZZZ|nr:hypothetical protein [uncultured prokaryote]
MRIWTVYRHGLTAGTPPGKNDHMRTPRGESGGWSKSSTRNNTRFLYSVDERALTGHGFALSLTLRECPPTSDDWHKIRRGFEWRMRRMGMVRMHWLTEWQRRGVPHMHAAIWFDEGLAQRDPFAVLTIRQHWLAVAGLYGAGEKGQNIAHITDAMGWFKYLAKHAVRGLNHYQRSADNIPEGWTKTGRMWGKLGDWPIAPVRKFYLDDEGHFKARRVIRGYARAITRQEFQLGRSPVSRLMWARNLLKCGDRGQSSLRGLNDWAEADKITAPLLLWLVSEGHEVDVRQPAIDGASGEAGVGAAHGDALPEAAARSGAC